MTGVSYPEGRVRARHVDPSRPVDWLTRHFRPAEFLQWMLVICLALVLWPASFGGRFGMVIVAGTSMEPTYQLGDAVITWREPVDVGDVTLYQVPHGFSGAGAPVIHRVVSRDGSGWVTQGDNTRYPDRWRPTDQDMLGVAKMKVPFGGYFLNLMRSWWFIALLGGMATALMLWPDNSDDLPAPGRHLA